MTKVALLLLWAASILCLFFLNGESYQQYIIGFSGLILLIHFVEYIVVKTVITKDKTINISFLLTMFFGFAHWLPLINQRH